MFQKSVSPQTNEREWLQSLYDEKKKRSFELGVKAIDLLVKEGSSVSYRTVSDKSKKIDAEGIGIHPNTIRKNKELHAYFSKHISAKLLYKPRKSSRVPIASDLDSFKQIKQDRDITRVKQRYMQLTKNELVNQLIQMEQYIANQNQHWLKNQFESFKSE
ncbi:hypothetical protein M5X11_34195 [Paenibacillus alginolyticus]|uniref:hypothetical protein n=1 Tax=Paenibacillus alginolyticus TaxID=59839 RepID=UPI0003F79752|nr:hypothetical protein [Paenibacillus alginolyticus]MCY9669905.1 hypothetical protein [Paenibacillus alginolyticus]